MQGVQIIACQSRMSTLHKTGQTDREIRARTSKRRWPTLAELCGLPSPQHLEGTSLSPLLRNTAKSVKTAAFSQAPRSNKGRRLMGYSMRTEHYPFTCWVDRNDHSEVEAIELYDHQTDPRENINIANDPKNYARSTVP